MKKIIMFVAIMLTLQSVAFAEITREQLYRYFGPRFVEAVILVIKDEINTLRREAGLEERTNQQILNALENKYNVLGRYDWER